jgi:DNA repair protein RadC
MKFIVRDFRAAAVDRSPELMFHQTDAPDRVYRFYREVVEADAGYEPEKEHVVVLALSTRLRLLGWHMVAMGGFSEAACHPREVLRPIIVRGAHSFVLCHNHPSGDPGPSPADHRVTKRVKEASELFQIVMLDHIIIGRPSPGRSPYFSFREAGCL